MVQYLPWAMEKRHESWEIGDPSRSLQNPIFEHNNRRHNSVRQSIPGHPPKTVVDD